MKLAIRLRHTEFTAPLREKIARDAVERTACAAVSSLEWRRLFATAPEAI